MGGYYSWMFGRRVCMAADSADKTLAEHDKQYHKEGYKEGDECKLREETRKQDDFDSEDSPLSLSEIKKLLKTKYGVTLCNYEAASNIVAKEGTEGFKEGWKYTEKATDDEVRETASRVLRVLDDLKTRFGYTPQLDYLCCVRFSNFKENIVGGLSEIDHLYTKNSMIAINVNPSPWEGFMVGHDNMNDHKESIIRHEIGHVESNHENLNGFKKALSTIRTWFSIGSVGDLQFLESLKEVTSEYAVSTGILEELFAEAFSKHTDRNFKHKISNDPINKFFESILQGETDESINS